jgi:hypothetical protein
VRVSRGSGEVNAMKSGPETVQEPTPWEKFLDLARKVVQTPKAEVDKRERAWRAERKKRKRRE